MFEVDPLNERIEVSGESVYMLDFVTEELWNNSADMEAGHLLEVAAARGEAARLNNESPKVTLSLEVTQFIHDKAQQLLEDETTQITSFRQRVKSALSGRLGAIEGIRDEAAEALVAAQSSMQEENLPKTENLLPNGQPVPALDPISLAMHARATQRDRHARETVKLSELSTKE